MRARPRHAFLAALGAAVGLVVTCSVAAGMVPPPAAAATARPRAGAAPTRVHRPNARRDRTVMRPAPGVTVRRQAFSIGSGRPERATLMRIQLARGISLDAASPEESIGAQRRTVSAQADLTGAIGGINADWFDLESPSAVPRGALIRDGRVIKTPRPGWSANFYVRPDGTAGIGPVPFHGSVSVRGSTSRAGARPLLRDRILSVNTPNDAAQGQLVYLTHALVALNLRRPCTVATGRTTPHGGVVTAVRSGVWHVHRVPRGRWALASCGGPGAAWLRGSLRAGTAVDITLDFPEGTPRVAVSGGRVLLQDGRAYRDVGGQRLLGLNPETFACVSRTGRSALLGVVDGRSRRSVGVTQPQLQKYLLRLHCWSAMTFDGGGSSTIVARPQASATDHQVEVLNVPSDGRPRQVADGLYVYAG